MPAHKKLLHATIVKPAGRARKCYHSRKHQIVMGDVVLEVREGLGFKGYCRECAVEMLRIAEAEIDAIRAQISEFD